MRKPSVHCILAAHLLLFYLLPLLIFSQSETTTYRKLFAHKSGISDVIRSKLEILSVNPDYKIAGEKFHNIEYVTHLYQQTNYHPFWSTLQSADDAVAAILLSTADGLIPPDYHLEAILVTKNALLRTNVIDPVKIEKAAEMELLMTDGILFYAYHLLYGKCDPVTLIPTWNFEFAPIPDLQSDDLLEYIKSRQIINRLVELRPDLPLYDTLLIYLSKYRELAHEGGWGTISAVGKIEPGYPDPRIVQIRHRLKITGELTDTDSLNSIRYDEILEKDIRRFQASHGLDADGIIGAGTIRELNIPVAQRIETIRVNLERLRWVTRDLPDRYILVNIAGFWLVMYENSQIVHKANVVVGRSLSETPVFRDKLRYIDFNPTWTVPRSIIRDEIIPGLKKDSLYLRKQNMILLDSKGNEVHMNRLDLANLSANRLPYLVRQQPGPNNSLGVVKFMFPNEYDIYLHDTPSKYLFSKAKRAYSHGCIRVEKPLDLAGKLLEGTEWTRDKMEQTVRTRETTRVLLPGPVDIMILYWTCGLNPEGQFFFAQDIYDRDGEVLKKLDQLLR